MGIRNRTLIEFLALAIDFLSYMYIHIIRQEHALISRKNIQTIGRTEMTEEEKKKERKKY